MTNKYYKLLAEAFTRIHHRVDEGWFGDTESKQGIVDEIEDEICLILNHENPAFDYQKFTDASGRKD